jgi:hypothetical protein
VRTMLSLIDSVKCRNDIFLIATTTNLTRNPEPHDPTGQTSQLSLYVIAVSIPIYAGVVIMI